MSEREAEIRRSMGARHFREVIAVHEGHGEEAWCPACQQHWPCDVDWLLARLDAVRELHAPVTELGRTYCTTCAEWVMSDTFEGAVGALYPCPTIQALEEVDRG